MKKLLFLLIFLISGIFIFAQSPRGMNYQAVARDKSGNILADHDISLRVDLSSQHEKSATIYYTEYHKVRTNSLGLFTLVIGEGDNDQQSFDKVPWSTEDIWMAISIQDNKDGGFAMITNTKLLAVPYAYYAVTASQLVNNNTVDSDDLSIRSNPPGVPSNVWSLKGNYNSNPEVDKLGTTDYQDLVIVTNNIERMRILASGDINFSNSVNIGNDLSIDNNITIGNDLNVDHDVNLNVAGGTTNINGALTVTNNAPTVLTGTLKVQQATDLDQSLNVAGTTTLNNTLTVADEAKTVLSGDLYAQKNAFVTDHFEVQGTTYLFGETLIGNYARIYGLTVDGLRPTLMTGNLNVNGTVDFDKTLNVDGKTTLGDLQVNGQFTYGGDLDVDGNLTVNGATTLNGDFTSVKRANLKDGFVTNGSSTFNQSFVAKKTTFFHQGFQSNGTVDINVDVNGPDYAIGSYPLWVQGSNQGIYIILNGTATTANNFLTFSSHDQGTRGCIQGQTLSEKQNSFSYIWQSTMLAFDIAQPTLEAIACAANVPPDAAEIASNGLAAGVATTNESVFQQTENNNAGVAFVSGSGDYAEWLPKGNKKEEFSYGDIVGVNGGNISKDTKGAANFMVVSMAPIVLGNMPPANEEKDYEKVAFMGQVPVKVIGQVSIGDYILPSGSNNGFGIAVHPSEMNARQYREIVGVAWSASDGKSGLSYINTAIGISQHVIADKLEAIQNETDRLKAEVADLNAKMDQVMAALNGKEIKPYIQTVQNTPVLASTPLVNTNSTVNLESISNTPTTSSIDLVAMQKQAKAILDERGINYNLFEQTRKLVTDPNYLEEMMQAGVIKLKPLSRN